MPGRRGSSPTGTRGRFSTRRNGPTPVIDAGERLIRATYDDGADATALSADDARARMRDLQSRAEKLLFELG